MKTLNQDAPDFARRYPNLASPRFGAEAVASSDEFFASRDRLIQDAPAVFIPDKYDDHGKWMDGWESQRRRDDGNDWCIVRLGAPGSVYGVDIDTSHFTGNYPPAASIDALPPGVDPTDPAAPWQPLLARCELGPSARHFFAVDAPGVWGALRLNIFPDGGVARLRVYGAAAPSGLEPGAHVELSALTNGGRIVAYNDAHYGDVWALLSEGRGRTMGDGWETRRRREPGSDWMIIALGRRGVVDAIEIDTAHFKGNFPDSASLQAADLGEAGDEGVVTAAMFWPELMSPQKLSADSIHQFGREALSSLGPVTHVRLNIHPDGGVSRLRVFGEITP